MHVLVTGGAGYIGSHTVLALLEAGHTVVIVDSLVNANAAVLPRLEKLSGTTIPFEVFDLADAKRTKELFEQQAAAGTPFDAVIHFAGLKAVGESVSKPLWYYQNNIDATLSVLAAMADSETADKLVFSSSATVYGERAPVPYQEDWEFLESTNPYGQTKVIIERILTDVAAAEVKAGKDWKVALLRYFNPIGAHESGLIGEDPNGIPNNLMPFLSHVAVGRREKLTVFGDDYPTADGTGERDYIHVVDLAEAHVKALEHLANQQETTRAYNIGTGSGTSVYAMITAMEKATGFKLPYEVGPRRAGDLPVTYADPTRATNELGWTPTRTVEDMVADTWRWQQNNPNGYGD